MYHYDGQNTAFQYYRNPYVDAYRAFGRFVLVKDYEDDNYGDDVDVDKIATNRSSTVTLFHHPNLGLKMLFTADAYDQNCDIRRTILEYNNTTETQQIKAHILKVGISDLRFICITSTLCIFIPRVFRLHYFDSCHITAQRSQSIRPSTRSFRLKYT